MTLEEIQAKMEREAPGFVANPREPQKIRREMKMYDSAVSAIRVAAIVIIAVLTYSLLVINGDVQLPSWLDI
eukprot:CAMPEP_0197529916 /NCGR_PEP_ID=MMETSP1318-20131121/30059_1 /TAXON_ID=552666 /ORGANISM="Partenskyella glossopodia, Strain RCC365" /LENGTH=71 /DNA_ID=CAMNT_0043085545 /DNA_START=420 /DNA_END=635 /DNA_ORIENTATION=+